MSKMKECERCPKLFKCNDKLVCGNSSNDNYDRFIEAIDECDVYGPDAIEELPFTYTEVHMDSSEIDSINHPGHYETGKFECIDVMLKTQGTEAVKNFCICNAFKYLYRHKRKSGIEDIKKADWYLKKYIELEEAKNEDRQQAD